MLPSAGLGAGGAVGLSGRLFRIEVLGRYWSPRTAELGDAGGRFSLWTVGVRGCPEPSYKTLRFPLCLGVDAGQMSGEGVGLDYVERAVRPYVSAAIAPALVWGPTPRMGVFVGVEGVVPLLRPTFEAQNVGTIHRTGAFAGQANLGIEVHFP